MNSTTRQLVLPGPTSKQIGRKLAKAIATMRKQLSKTEKK